MMLHCPKEKKERDTEETRQEMPDRYGRSFFLSLKKLT